MRVLAEQPRICPHLHLCLQSGSDRILARMKRRYRSGGFLERCRRIRAALDRPAFTTDVIVGFPGETEADFEATCRVVREVGFARLHVFSYSPRAGHGGGRAGARACRPPSWPSAAPDCWKSNATWRTRIVAVWWAGRLDVLVEGADPRRPGFVRGTACRGVTVICRGHAPALIRRRVPVRAVAVTNGVVLGEPVEWAGEGGPPEKTRIGLPLAAENMQGDP